jgi:hypothetical protein
MRQRQELSKRDLPAAILQVGHDRHCLVSICSISQEWILECSTQGRALKPMLPELTRDGTDVRASGSETPRCLPFDSSPRKRAEGGSQDRLATDRDWSEWGAWKQP